MGLDSQVVSATRDRLSLQELFRTIVSLFKLRIVMLLLAAALGGAFLGAQGVPSLRTLIGIIVTGTLAAGGASAINQYIERERDALMRRTQRRPLPAGEIQRPAAILWIAIGMIVLSVALTLPTNPLMALYLALGAAIYVGVYTLWLKPRSVLNIVIGGAAGSMAVMTGGAAVRAASDPGVIVLALLLFLWTPVHFWALALFYNRTTTRPPPCRCCPCWRRTSAPPGGSSSTRRARALPPSSSRCIRRLAGSTCCRPPPSPG